MPDFVKTFLEEYEDIGALFLSAEYEVAVTTVWRWTKGIARPHPLLQLDIINSINEFKS